MFVILLLISPLIIIVGKQLKDNMFCRTLIQWTQINPSYCFTTDTIGTEL
jgi:hypothetical protein